MCDLSNVVTWLLVILGWVLVHYLTTVRERRKDIGEAVAGLVDRIYELEDDAIKFHKAESFDHFAARDIVTEVSRVSMDLVTAPFSALRIRPDLMKQVRRSMTLQNFEEARFKSLPANNQVIGKIGAAADDLARAVRGQYHDRYYSHWWQCMRA